MEKIKSFLLIVNPISGGVNKKHLISEVEACIENYDIDLEIYYTQGVNDKENIQKLIDIEKPDRVVVAGGDGTIKLAAEAMEDKQIPLGIIPAGSANGLAFNLELPTTMEDQVKVALGDEFLEMDLLELNGEICLHMSDLGVNAELIKNYESSTIRGKFGYLLQTIPTLINSKYPFKFTIKTGKGEFEREGILLAFANAQKYGTGANVNPEGQLDDGVFEILVFKNFDIFQILKTLRNEVKHDPEFIEIIPAKEARVTCKKPVAFQIDGEYLGEKKEIEVKILPRKLQIAVPASSENKT